MDILNSPAKGKEGKGSSGSSQQASRVKCRQDLAVALQAWGTRFLCWLSSAVTALGHLAHHTPASHGAWLVSPRPGPCPWAAPGQGAVPSRKTSGSGGDAARGKSPVGRCVNTLSSCAPEGWRGCTQGQYSHQGKCLAICTPCKNDYRQELGQRHISSATWGEGRGATWLLQNLCSRGRLERALSAGHKALRRPLYKVVRGCLAKHLAESVNATQTY